MNKLLTFFWVMLHVIVLTKTARAYDYNWNDYTEPYKITVNVPLSRGSTVYVDLPADYVRNNSFVKLHVDLQSNFTYRIDGLEQKGFEGFSPKISVNGGVVRGNYTIRVKAIPVRQTAILTIKTKYLKAGKNALKFYVGRESEVTYRCKAGKACIVFFVHEIYFDDFKSTKKSTIAQSTVTVEKPKPSTSRDRANIEGSFEGEYVNMRGWNFGNLFQQKTGEGGFQKVFIDESRGAKDTHRCLAMHFRLSSTKANQSENPRPPLAILRNGVKRDLSDYEGIEFYIRATEDFVIIFGMADSESATGEEERWNRTFLVTTEVKKMRIPFDSLSLFKRRALRQGTNQILELNRIEAIHWVAHGRNVPIGTEATIYLDEISFY